MATADHVPPSGALNGPRQVTSLARAWISVALIPVAFVVAFAVSEGLYGLLGYKPEEATEPLWVALVAGIPAVLLFLAPCVAAVLYGNRARTQGHRSGWVPLAVGAGLGLWVLVGNIATLLAL